MTSNITFQKSFFEKFARLPFLVVDHVLRISRTFCVYVKCSPQSEETFDTVYNVIRHKIVILWQEKVIFVNFYKMKRRRSIEYSVIFVKFALMRPLQGIEKKFQDVKSKNCSQGKLRNVLEIIKHI